MKNSHRAVQGWWSVMLEISARRYCHGSPIGSASRLPPDLDGRSITHPLDRASHHEGKDQLHDDTVRRSSSNMSRTNSMHRTHFDVSEYDAQGDLTKHTITDSYTSLPDAAMIPMERYHSSSG